MKAHKLHIVQLTSVPVTLWFLEELVRTLRQLRLEVTAISSPGPELERFEAETGAATCAVPITRTLSPLADLCSLLRLYRTLRRIQPDVVNAGTPKAGLLGVLAARLAGVRAIVFHVHGLPHVCAAGVRGLALRLSTRIACALCHRVICVSHSNAEVLVKGGFCRRTKVVVPANGSACGVDAAGKFNPASVSWSQAVDLKRCFGIPENALTIGFAGRLVSDKGCRELAAAWREVSHRHPYAHLMLAGEPEAHDPLPPGVLDSLQGDLRVHFLGNVTDMPLFFRAIDVLVLPTYREGFPVVVLEASAMGVPVVATRTAGCIDAVVDGVTGTLVEPRDSQALAQALDRYLDNAELRTTHGRSARLRVVREFQPAAVIAATLAIYRQVMEHGGRPVPKELDAATVDSVLGRGPERVGLQANL